MKKAICCVAILMTFFSCSNSNNDFVEDNLPVEKVQFTIGYSLQKPIEGSMSKRGYNPDSLYNQFYKKYIETKILTPKNYYINIETMKGEVIGVTTGRWENMGIFELPEGVYIFDGHSSPNETNGAVGDSIFIGFRDTVTIDKNTRHINLKSYNRCHMLFISNENVRSCKLYGTSFDSNGYDYLYDLEEKDDILYTFRVFSNNLDHLYVESKDGNDKSISLKGQKFYSDRYYTWDIINGNYETSPMQPGK